MPEGGCLCKSTRYSFEGEPEAQVLCHCVDCRKISGSAFSTNYMVPADGFKLTKGNPKEFAKTADSGSHIKSYFCGDCGSTLYRQTPTYDGKVIIKAGTIDEPGIEQTKPMMELFAKHRVDWVPAIEGAQQN